ncbi:MAG: translesion error-prone DNA polymerase V autoproteolytic subunit [Candidatus Aminicenantes bacterium]|nr:translesion error-prone DNA polymerase V autoproteolytic subunit [Candidatus Aminicenantes bacterium]
MKKKPVEIFAAVPGGQPAIPLYLSLIPAGFPSPADDYIDRNLDLNEYLVKHPAATFFVKVSGDSMIHAGIDSGDILVVDRALEPHHNKIIVAVVDGEFTVKRLKKTGNRVFLVPENNRFPVMEIKEGTVFEVWGVVTTVIHKV